MNEQDEFAPDNRDEDRRERWVREKELAASSSVPHLLRQLTSEVTTLFSKEVSLARAEARETVGEVKTGIVALLSGSGVLLPGLIVLLMAAVYGLANFMDLWLAALIVGGAVTVVGMSMVAAGKHKLGADSIKPDRTAHSLRKDRDTFRHAVKGGRP
jgi:hypothetical protein